VAKPLAAKYPFIDTILNGGNDDTKFTPNPNPPKPPDDLKKP